MDVVHHPSQPALGAAGTPARGAWLVAIALLLLVAGCRREEVTSYRVAKDVLPPAEGASSDPLGASHRPAAPPPGMAGDVPVPPTPSGADALKWTLPAGWGQTFPGGMRFATFKVPGTGKIDGSVVTLAGDAGGELANVNRWRGQIGLGPTDDGGLAAARTTVKTRAGMVNVYDFTSEGTRKSRLIAAIVMVDGSAWFIKLTGDAEPVGAARPAFLALLGASTVNETSSASFAAHKLWDVVTSLKLTIVCLALLMLLVVACTLAQVQLGTFGAVNLYMRSFVVWWQVPGTGWSLAIFPGGATVGLVLMVNLFAAQLRRLELSWKKSGIWVVHAGLILLFVGEFVTGVFQVETQLAIEEGQTVNYVEHPRQQELIVVDSSDPAWDQVHSVPESLLADGGLVAIPGTPVVLLVRRYWENAQLSMPGPGFQPVANMGVGANVAVQPLRPVVSDERINMPVAVVEPRAGGRSYGAWLVSSQLGAPQQFAHEGQTYSLAMRPRRQYLPYSMTLKKFSHDVYEGTNIPKNFSSLVRLSNPAKGESRDVLIYMNQPLRYGGKAFYQASFGKNDTLSILQVVENPGWLLPYISCVLVGLGLMIHFGISLSRSLKRRAAAEA